MRLNEPEDRTTWIDRVLIAMLLLGTLLLIGFQTLHATGAGG